MSKNLRIIYAVGPEDVIKAYNYWSKNQDDPSQVSVTYSSQFYELCRDIDAYGYVIAQSPQQEIVRDQRFIIERRLIPSTDASGISYHFRQIWFGLRLLISAIRFQANIIVVDNGITHWFFLSIFAWIGIKVIPSLQCTLWCKYYPPSLGEKLALRLSRNFFAFDCKAILAVSHDIAAQVDQLTLGQHQEVFEFFPTFYRADFENIPPAKIEQSPFRVLFVGRVEQSKGVFDLLEIAKRFASENRRDIKFDICGEGSLLEPLRLAAKQADVGDFFIFHGYCNKMQMKELFSSSHVVIVPTRKDFVEGFNRVVSESILSGRPVITSAVCPALYYVKDAAIEVAPNDVKAYGDALLDLYSDRQLYEEKRKACVMAQEQFYDTGKSWGNSLKSIIEKIQ
ncbi:glycosyltransferase family 4 protein [Calothrix sp. PCC 7507]|uniref:glycosyltransferase family 4 protein n=1 Tax=Calothrix sp. PCC 7507 TaxID=99598 RepID=UPI00029EF3E0|nr:glycosyltransferase family 4 protein [Calothrix sp. PCC 7507]AFY35652.1 glycosyl transferase group 1 [Calothrix sp. PCC 7507]